MTERSESREEYRRNAEARFASPENSDVGIGYYDDDGTPLTPEEFDRRVAEDAERREREEARSS